MSRKIPKEKFIADAIAIHGDEYDYSSIVYVDMEYKIQLKCKNKDHKSFWMAPRNHLMGRKCRECAVEKVTKTTKQFIIEAKLVHGNKYDYSETEYLTVKDKVKIICLTCPDRKVFWQRPDIHLNNHGCPTCGRKQSAITATSTTEEFIQKAIVVHGNKFIYDLVNYIDSDVPVKIICVARKHTFDQRPASHLIGNGCWDCAIETVADKLRYSFEDYIEKCNIKYNFKYDYSKSEENYSGAHSKIVIVCPELGHGEFIKRANIHLFGEGCPICTDSKHKNQNDWLDSFKNPNIIKRYRMKIDGRLIKPDGIDFTTNIIYEFYGDLYHGNPNRYTPNHYTYLCKTADELYQNTLEREARIKSAGYNLITIWESDWLLHKKLQKYILKLKQEFLSWLSNLIWNL
jgi:hypothetical protein